jgi:hypothetical protein
VEEIPMWFMFGAFGVILYLILVISLGMATLRNGHVLLFILGFFFPLLWIFGALMQPRAQPV